MNTIKKESRVNMVMFQLKRFFVFIILLLTFSGCEIKCDANVESKNARAERDTVEAVKTEKDSTFIINRKMLGRKDLSENEENISAGIICIEGKKYVFFERFENWGYAGGAGVGLEKTGETCSQ